MQTVVDSKERPLPAPTVITTALGELDLGNITPAAAMAGIAKEMTMKDTDMVQIGNTVFIGHRGKGENKDLMWGRALNIDTAQNFVANGLNYQMIFFPILGMLKMAFPKVLPLMITSNGS